MTLPSLEEIRQALIGCLGLIMRDPDAANRFDLSIGGFWRSFFALVIGAPVFLLVIMSHWRLAESMEAEFLPPANLYLMVQSGAYLVSWAAWPLAMVPIARLLDLRNSYIPYIIAYNWASLLILLVTGVPYLMAGFGLLTPTALAFFITLLLGATLWYRWVIAREALGAPVVTAVGLVLADFLLTLLIDELSLGLMRSLAG